MSVTVLASAPPRSNPTIAYRFWTNQRLSSLLTFALIVGSLAVIGSYLVIATAHVNDNYQVTHTHFVAGVYTGLAQYVNAGRLYPDLYDGSHFGGTRYMPLQFLLHAGMARLTGEYLISGKLLAAGLADVLIVQLFLLLRRSGCSPTISLALPSLVLTSSAGFYACTTIRGDLLPVVCQLAALVTLQRTISPRKITLAGLFCTLGILAKLTAVWAPMAITLYLLIRDRRACFLFVGICLGSLALSLGLLHVVSGGRMLENFVAVSTAGVGGIGAFLKSPFRLLLTMSKGGTLFQFLVPFVLIECGLAIRQRRCTLWHYSFACCVPVLLLIYADMGTTSNHVVDLIVLSVLLLGSLWSYLQVNREMTWNMQMVLTLAILWGMASAWAFIMGHPTQEAASALMTGKSKYPQKPLAKLVRDDETLLTEDGWVAISRGQIPTILDTYSLARFAKSRPELVEKLVSRVERQEFDKIVLLHRLDADDPGDEEWYDMFISKPVVETVLRRYRLLAMAEGYCVYVPRRGDAPANLSKGIEE